MDQRGRDELFLSDGYLSLLNPNGTTLSGPITGSKLDSVQLPSTGTYTLNFDPYGAATGNATLWVSSDQTGTITLDGASVPLTLARVGQNARYTFSGTAGQFVNLGITADTINTTYVSMLKPDGTTLVSPTYMGTSGGSLNPPVLPATGTYTIVVAPYGTNTGNLTLTLSSTVTGTLAIGNPATAVTLGTPGQSGRFTFSGTASQQVTVHVTGNTMTNFATGCVSVTLYNTSNAYMTGGLSCSANFNLATQTLTATGTYSITVVPANATTGSLNLNVTSP